MNPSFRAAGVPAFALLLGLSPLAAKQDSLVISVYSRTSPSYRREFLPDGNIKPQTYVVGNGGIANLPGRSSAGDPAMFPTIVRLLARRLTLQNFYPARQRASADLLLVIHWGTTVPFDDAQLQNANANFGSAMNQLNNAEAVVRESEARGEQQTTTDGIQIPIRSARDAAREDAETQLFQSQLFQDMRLKADEANARLLGYVEEINLRDNPSRYAGAGNYFDDLMNDIETPRFYVIVQAYDFQSAAIDGRRKLLWTTRMSIPAYGSDFSRCLPAMLSDASQYFGRDCGRLVRNYREGVVRLGELEVLGTEPEGQAEEAPPAETPK
ncbi:MAG TPA: hypothetical protein VHD61_11330 [Lacunisphaera sp.]|nr:hypothetical protein [Lacunisphaera sp.]